jgi:hypothetical protein
MTINMDGDTLNLERRSDDGKLFVSGVQIVAKDVVGTNGIIHVIDDIIMPDSGKCTNGIHTYIHTYIHTHTQMHTHGYIPWILS